MQDGGSIPPASTLKELKMFEMKFKNDVTVTVQWEPQYLDSKKYRQTAQASASHDKVGSLQVTSFEKRYTEDKEILFGLEPDELLKFMNKAASMRFTEEGEQCIAFFDF